VYIGSHCLAPVVDKPRTSCYHLVTRLMRPTTTCSNKSDIGLVDIRIQEVFALLVASCWLSLEQVVIILEQDWWGQQQLVPTSLISSGWHQDSGCVCTTCSQTQLLWQVYNKLLSLCCEVGDSNRFATSCFNMTNTGYSWQDAIYELVVMNL
jgi:hypothetical protein